MPISAIQDSPDSSQPTPPKPSTPWHFPPTLPPRWCVFDSMRFLTGEGVLTNACHCFLRFDTRHDYFIVDKRRPKGRTKRPEDPMTYGRENVISLQVFHHSSLFVIDPRRILDWLPRTCPWSFWSLFGISWSSVTSLWGELVRSHSTQGHWMIFVFCPCKETLSQFHCDDNQMKIFYRDSTKIFISHFQEQFFLSTHNAFFKDFHM